MPIRIEQTEHDHIPDTFTIESLKEAGFTDQEIAAASEGDDPIVAPEEPEAAAEPLPDDPDAGPGVGAGGDEAELASEPAAEAAEPDPDPTAAEPEPPADPFANIEPPKPPEPVDISAHEQAIAESKTALTDLMAKYDDGELTADEFAEQQDQIIEQQATARAAIKAAEATALQGSEAIQNHWFNVLDTYKALGTEALWSEEHLANWDRHLRTVTGQESYANLTLPKQIEMAHRLYAAEFEATRGEPLGIPIPGQQKPKAASDADADAEPKKAQRKVSEDPRPEPPKTLAGLNSDGDAEVEDSVFANIDRTADKDPIRAEEMVARLTPDQMQRFLEGA